MKIAIISVGRIKKDYIKDGFNDYVSRVSRYAPIETHEVKDAPASKKTLVGRSLKVEAERITGRLRGSDYVVALTDSGRAFTSKEFSRFMERIASSGRGKKRICFIVGGSYGLHPTLVEGSDASLSLSKMTMPHELARLVLAEQLYRAFTISRGEPYSH